MILEETLNKLKDDTHYYGDFGKQFLSNSDIKVLLTNPLSLHDKQDTNINFLVGGYFHTCILEPDKLKKYKVIESSTRNTKKYKEISGGEMCLLQHEVDRIDLMAEKLLNNNVCRDLIQIQHDDKSILYEAPAVKQIGDNWWKGKADIINHNEKLVKHFNKWQELLRVVLIYLQSQKTKLLKVKKVNTCRLPLPLTMKQTTTDSKVLLLFRRQKKKENLKKLKLI
jgi:hypothetical protein